VDTVRPYNPRNGQGNGFLFAEYLPRVLMETLSSALAAYPNKKIWTRLQKNGMRADVSWDRSAGEYVKMYRKLRRRPQKAQQAQQERGTPRGI
jgi:starch synthase